MISNLNPPTSSFEPTLELDAEVEKLRDLIQVQSPYYALKNLRRAGDELVADVSTDLIDHPEVNGMSLAEVGRHMAILGSLTMVEANPRKEKHYYLATYAEFHRIRKEIYPDTELTISMACTEFNKKKGKATGYLMTRSGERLFQVSVHYVVLPTRIFERMYAKGLQETNFDKKINPYVHPNILSDVVIDPEVSTASVGIVQQETCSGHFDNYPALPVARIGGILATLTGLHFNEWLGKKEYYSITKAYVTAESFVFAGEEVTLDCREIEENDYPELGTLYLAYASTKTEKNVASLKCWME